MPFVSQLQNEYLLIKGSCIQMHFLREWIDEKKQNIKQQRAEKQEVMKTLLEKTLL